MNAVGRDLFVAVFLHVEVDELRTTARRLAGNRLLAAARYSSSMRSQSTSTVCSRARSGDLRVDRWRLFTEITSMSGRCSACKVGSVAATLRFVFAEQRPRRDS